MTPEFAVLSLDTTYTFENNPSTLFKPSHLSERFPAKLLTGIAVTDKQKQEPAQDFGWDYWERDLLILRVSCELKLVWGKLPRDPTNVENWTRRRESGEERFPDTILWKPRSGLAWKLSTPWTFSYTSLVLLKPLGVHSFFANEIVMTYPLCSHPSCGLAWIEGHIYPEHVTSDCDCTCTQTSLGRYKQANGKDGKRDKSCQHPVVPRNRTWMSVHYRVQLLSITEEISKVKRHDMTKPELELASATQSHVEWKLFSSEPKCQTWTTHIRKHLWFGATTRVKRLSLKLLKKFKFSETGWLHIFRVGAPGGEMGTPTRKKSGISFSD